MLVADQLGQVVFSDLLSRLLDEHLLGWHGGEVWLLRTVANDLILLLHFLRDQIVSRFGTELLIWHLLRRKRGQLPVVPRLRGRSITLSL